MPRSSTARGDLASSPFRSSHHQPRNRLAGFETELGGDDLRPQARIRQQALDVSVRVAVTPVGADGVLRIAPGVRKLFDGEDESSATTQRVLGSRDDLLERPEIDESVCRDDHVERAGVAP